MTNKSGLGKLELKMARVETRMGSFEETQKTHTQKLDGIKSTLDTVLTAHAGDIKTLKEDTKELKETAKLWNWKFLGMAGTVIIITIIAVITQVWGK